MSPLVPHPTSFDLYSYFKELIVFVAEQVVAMEFIEATKIYPNMLSYPPIPWQIHLPSQWQYFLKLGLFQF